MVDEFLILAMCCMLAFAGGCTFGVVQTAEVIESRGVRKERARWCNHYDSRAKYDKCMEIKE